jgi:hypothetical protein
MQGDQPRASQVYPANATISCTVHVSQLYSDVLSTVFTFLCWVDLLSSARTCKDWLLAAGKSKGRDLAIDLRRENDLHGLIVSPLHCHVTYVNLKRVKYEVAASTISQLVLSLPVLEHLTHHECVRTDTNQTKTSVMPVYSSRLQGLTVIRTPGCRVETRMLEHLVATAPNLIELNLEEDVYGDSQWRAVSLDCLQQLLRLKTLSIFGFPILAHNMAAIARLPALTEILAYDHTWTPDDLTVLARGVCKLQTFDFLSVHVTPPMMEALLYMPSLTSLELYNCASQALLQLRRFPQLTSLQFDTRCVGNTTQSLLRDALTGCTLLRKLRIHQDHFIEHTTSELLMALDAVPLLTELDLNLVPLTSCDFLQFVPRLTSLRLHAHARQDSPSTSLLQALCQYVPLLTSLECSTNMLSSDARYVLKRFGHTQFMPQLARLTLTQS